MNNPLKQYPNLFANGKFYLQYGEFGNEYPPVIEGVDLHSHSFIVERVNIYIDDCTLIARPISSLTNDEVVEIEPNFDGHERIAKTQWESQAKTRLLPSYIFMGITDVGVYPFDQSHFKTGTVIDSSQSDSQS